MGRLTLGRPAKKNVPKPHQLAFQRHLRKGLQLLGVTQANLQRPRTIEELQEARRTSPSRAERASDYRWIRKHLSASDPHFTYAVARELFSAVAEHPGVAKLPEELGPEWAQWGFEAENLRALDPDEALNEGEPFAFLPPVQHTRFAEEIVAALEREATGSGKRRFSAARKSQMTRAIASWLHRSAPRMAYRLGNVYAQRIADRSNLDLKQCHDVLTAAHETAFSFELGRESPKPSNAAKRGPREKTTRNGGKTYVR